MKMTEFAITCCAVVCLFVFGGGVLGFFWHLESVGILWFRQTEWWKLWSLLYIGDSLREICHTFCSDNLASFALVLAAGDPDPTTPCHITQSQSAITTLDSSRLQRCLSASPRSHNYAVSIEPRLGTIEGRSSDCSLVHLWLVSNHIFLSEWLSAK